MNRTMIEGMLRQLKGRLSAGWATLIHDERLRVRAEEDRMVGDLQRRYGRLKRDAERLLGRWTARTDHSATWSDWHRHV